MKERLTFVSIATAVTAIVSLMASQPDPVFLDLQATRAAYPTPMSAAQQAALLNEVAFRHPGVGLQKKTSGNTCPQPTTGVSVACDILRFPGNVGRDVLGDAEGAGRPDWGAPAPADPATFVAPVDPGSGNPPPPPPPDLTGRVSALEGHVDTLRAVLLETNQRLSAQIAALDARVTALEQKPAAPFELPRLRVKGQTGRSLGHAHTFAADVEIVR